MVAFTGVEPESLSTHTIPIETMRALAVVMLVSFHVIGPESGAGLEIAYPQVLRLYADFFIDLRMPFFGFIAGYVYALRPVSCTGYPTLISGKFRRLYVPGCVAMILFAVVANVIGNRFALPYHEMWRVLVHSYVHFWFLQSILVIFVVFGLVDALARQKYCLFFFLAACAAYLGDFRFASDVFSVNGAIYLLPYFLLGVMVNRHGAELWAEAEKLTILLLVIAVCCALWNIKVLYETDVFSLVRRDVQSLGFGLATCALAMMWCPRLPMLERLSPYAFSIYLYHVFGTSGTRMVLDQMSVSQTELRFVLGVAGGLILPIVVHLVAGRMLLGDRLVLGRTAVSK